MRRSRRGRHGSVPVRQSVARAWSEALEGRVLLSGATLTADVNPIADADAARSAVINGALYFVAGDATHGFELWKSDGTPEGTSMLKDVRPGPDSSSIDGLTVAGGVLYFAADDGVHGLELWRTDGTPDGTTLVKDIYPGADPSSPASLVAYNGMLYFAATNPTFGREVWRSNGTTSGTITSIDLQSGSEDSNPGGLVVAGTRLYFTAIQGSSYYLWSSNGTGPGSTKLAQDVFEFAAVGTRVFFKNTSRGLSVTDGTVAGTKVVRAGIDPSDLIDVNGVAFFRGNDGVHGSELWRSDGTAAGTRMVLDIDPGSASGYANFQPGPVVSAGGRVYFIAETGNGVELWQSDGTASGTRRVSDGVWFGFGWPKTLSAVGGTVYYAVGTELWRTDGTEAGTYFVASAAAGAPFEVRAVGSNVLFMAGGVTGALWRSDGAPGGNATQLASLRLPSKHDMIMDAVAVGQVTYFIARGASGVDDLWRTDGTAAGTYPLRNAAPSIGSNPNSLTAFNGVLLFTSDKPSTGREWWRTDGTAAGTWMLKDVYPGAGSGVAGELRVAGPVAYFAGADGVNGAELWRTDGTTAGTKLVKDVRPGTAGSGPANLTVAGSTLYFTADDGSKGREVWKSDGTTQGTSLVADVSPGAPGTTFASSYLGEGGFAGLPNGRLVFSVTHATYGTELWGTDGTAAGTGILADLNPGAGGSLSTYGAELGVYQGRAYFGANVGGGASQLWSTDGTPQGTRMVFDVSPTGMSWGVQDFVELNGRLLFTQDGSTGTALWSTDGSPEGTSSVYGPGDGPSWNTSPGQAVAAGGMVYFWGYDRLHGREVWRTDGTALGTVRVADVQAGRDDGLMLGLYGGIVATGDRVYFASDNRDTGLGVWSLRFTPVAIAAASVPEGAASVALDAVPPGVVADPADPVTYVWDLDGDGVFGETGADALHGDEVGSAPTFLAAGLDGPLTLPVAVRATGSTTGASVVRGTVTIANRPPVPTMGPVPVGATEGAGVFLTGSATDSVADVAAGIRIDWVVRLGNDVVATGTGPAWEFVPPDGGSYAITMTATDVDGATAATAATTLVVGNVAPTATFVNAVGSAGMTTSLTITGASDVGAADMAAGLRYSFDLDNDGIFDVVDAATPAASRVFQTPGTYTVRARVRDKDGGASTYNATVTVGMPPAPTGTLSSGGAVNEGSPGSVGFGSVVGAGPFHYSYDFNNDGTFEVIGSQTASAVVPAAYLADGPFTRVVRARVTDAFGQFTEHTADIVVRNVAPDLAIPSAASGHVVLGRPYTLSVAASDAGQDHVTSWQVIWGDGRTSVLEAPAGLVGHEYSAAGTYQVAITAFDEDGSYTERRSLSVVAAPPAATFGAGATVVAGKAYRFSVTYTDDLGIDTATLGDDDVTVNGPAGTAGARLVSFTANGGATLATYEVDSPKGTWQWQDSGGYVVSIREGAVTDLQGLSNPAGVIGAFAVDLPAAPGPDLVVQLVKAAPKSIAPGVKNAATLKLVNAGDRTVTTTTLSTRLFLSADPVLDAGDQVLATSTQRGAILMNGSRTYTVQFVTPKVPLTGKYYLLAQADPSDKVAERDERNNVVASGLVTVIAPSSDLAVSLVGKPKASYKGGEAISLGVKVSNGGPSEAAGAGTLRVYFSSNPVLDEVDQLVLTSPLSLKLRTKASAVFNRSVKMPKSLPAGKWYLVATVDGTSVRDPVARNNTVSVPVNRI